MSVDEVENIHFAKIVRFGRFAIIAFFASTVLLVALLGFINPNITMLMLAKSRLFQENALAIQKQWVDIEDISSNMVSAAIAGEDNKFFRHHGFDFGEIKAAWISYKKGKQLRGASTISQQTAKNLCLWTKRSWVRKGLEVYYTVLLETLWSKNRILEVYLNIAELGMGIYGVECASTTYYAKSASRLNRREASLLATVLPSPSRRNPQRPSNYMLKYQQRILSLMKPYP